MGLPVNGVTLHKTATAHTHTHTHIQRHTQAHTYVHACTHPCTHTPTHPHTQGSRHSVSLLSLKALKLSHPYLSGQPAVCYRLCQSATACVSLLQVVSVCYRLCRSATGCVVLLQVVSFCYRLCRSATGCVSLPGSVSLLQVLSVCYKFCQSATGFVTYYCCDLLAHVSLGLTCCDLKDVTYVKKETQQRNLGLTRCKRTLT